MSVIRELSHQKRNVVLELFGTSKRRIEQKENVQSPINRPSKRFNYPLSSNASKLFQILKQTPSIQQPLYKSSKKNNESTGLNESICRKVTNFLQIKQKKLHIDIQEPRTYLKQIISPYRDFRSQVSFDIAPQTCVAAPRKISQPSQNNIQKNSVRRSNSFRDLFKSQITFG
ncbi:unnamed protein product (macronuclear) [Paramecium tetraurelia]|uniref:Uncharacterized protein n=1 Tax=Paramecium tetraurelia TaxID=5888 RepID=A0D0P7_PARTE|nr:uncharacterized protein GSPATT00012166001 [Paramecium tetraurelia]CAK76614.1 unnamed protein product [Paramecium tetraurelia]|eukprot:XP_001444011.1 hypothetical protein (macronuclear) [Paramecium tetraurelia strain d4-2]